MLQQIEMPRRRGRPPNVDRTAVVADEGPHAPIRRLTLVDLDEWLMGRLKARWPGYDDRTWIGKFNGFGLSNDILAITDGEVVGVFERGRHLMTGKPIVMEAFVFSRAAVISSEGEYMLREGSSEEARAYVVYQYVFEWAKAIGAVRVICSTCSDVPYYTIRRRRSCPYLADVR